MKSYLEMLKYVQENGVGHDDRTGTGTRRVFGYQLKHDLREGFPLLTTKKMFMRGLTEELIWFLHGETDVKLLQEKDVKIWDGWCDENGDAGPIYGFQWRHFGAKYHGIPGQTPVPVFNIETGEQSILPPDIYDGKGFDQIANLIKTINENPNSRRMVVSAWSPAQTAEMGLPPCHYTFQVCVMDGVLHLMMTQRSCDIFLGVPFNIASYALLMHMLAMVCDLEVGELTINFGDLHIYNNHTDQVEEQISREPKPLPTLTIDEKFRGTGLEGLLKITHNDIKLQNYKYHPRIKAEVSV